MPPWAFLATSRNPLRSRAGNEGCTVITVGVLPSSITGAKSLRTSNGKSLRMAGKVTSVLETITSVWPSGAARATTSAPSTPEAPGRFSTTMVWPSAGPSSLATVRASTSSVPPAGNGTMKCNGRAGNGACACAAIALANIASRPTKKARIGRIDALKRESSGDRRLRAFHLHAIARTDVRPVVPHRLVMGATVVPERNGVRRPAEAAGPFRLVAVIDEKRQHALAFEARQFVDMGSEVLIDVDHLAAGYGMTRDDGMHRDRRTGPEHARAVMGRGEAREIGFHPIGKRLIGRVHARKHGVAAAVRRNGMVVEHGAQWRRRGAGLITG